MIDINMLGDAFENMAVKIDQLATDGSSSWLINLTTKDITPSLTNAKPSDRSADISVVNHSDWNGTFDLDVNNILLPVTLAAVTKISDSQVKYYFRQRLDSKNAQLSPTTTIDGFIIKDAGEALDLSDPYLLISFVVEQSNQSDKSQFAGDANANLNLNLDTRNLSRTHVDKGENANGGVDLGRGESKENYRANEQQHDTDNVTLA